MSEIGPQLHDYNQVRPAPPPPKIRADRDLFLVHASDGEWYRTTIEQFIKTVRFGEYTNDELSELSGEDAGDLGGGKW